MLDSVAQEYSATVLTIVRVNCLLHGSFVSLWITTSVVSPYQCWPLCSHCLCTSFRLLMPPAASVTPKM